MAPAQPPSDLRVLETARVAPSPTGPPASLPLSFFDVFWLHSPPVERVFFYPLAPDANVPRLLSALKNSLSEAVSVFYPLAGRVRLTPGTANCYELFYQPGDGVAFTAAEYDADIDERTSHEPREVAKLAPLVPVLPDSSALFAVQVTVLLARRGLAVGVAFSHVASDGVSTTRFLRTWAAACAGEEAPPPPVIDRTLIPDPNGLYYTFVKNLLTADQMKIIKMCDDQLLATFTFSQELLQRVKDAVAVEAARRGAPPPRCTSLVAMLGVIWSCYCRAKATTANSKESADLVYAAFPVDYRARLEPPIPNEYFGNCIGAGIASAPINELTAAGVDGIFTAVVSVALAIDKAVHSRPVDWDHFNEDVKEAIVTEPLTMAGSVRFRVYELDFGFGRPSKVDIVSVARTGALGVSECQGSTGGMETGISLRPAGMERFQRCFADCIGWL